jgi:hypothetical protein
MQGELLPGCRVFVAPEEIVPDEKQLVEFQARDLIIVTQSCDLQKARDQDPIALCPVFPRSVWETMDATLRKGEWKRVEKKQRLGIHLLPPFPDDSEQLAVDLRQIYSVSARYLRKHTAGLGERRRLRSPFREDFSQVFGAFYSRVALPRPGDPD